MSDLGWQRYVDSLDREAFLEALSVERTKDEFGNFRYFVVDTMTGNWISDPFDTADFAFDEIERMRDEG